MKLSKFIYELRQITVSVPDASIMIEVVSEHNGLLLTRVDKVYLEPHLNILHLVVEGEE